MYWNDSQPPTEETDMLAWGKGAPNVIRQDVYRGMQKEYTYRKTCNIRRTPVGNNIVDHSDVVGASPVGAAPTTSSFST